MNCEELRDKASEVLKDVAGVTWTVSDLLSSMRFGIRAVCVLRPDAYTETGNIALVAGKAEQSLPDGAQRLVAVYHNIDIYGQPGKAINGMARLADKNHSAPNWPMEASADYVFEVAYDENVPKLFWVSPPVLSGRAVRATWVVEPTVEDLDWSDELPIDAKYGAAILEWMLYLSFARDSERTPNAQRAQYHKQSFFSLMQVKMMGDVKVMPGERSEASG